MTDLTNTIRDIVGLPPRESAYDCELTITELGVKWTASIAYDCTRYDGHSDEPGGYEVDVDSVHIQPVSDPQANWIAVDIGELSYTSQCAIEDACIEAYCNG